MSHTFEETLLKIKETVDLCLQKRIEMEREDEIEFLDDFSKIFKNLSDFLAKELTRTVFPEMPEKLYRPLSLEAVKAIRGLLASSYTAELDFEFGLTCEGKEIVKTPEIYQEILEWAKEDSSEKEKKA